MATGLFLSFEGGEGAGKSTQAHRLADSLRALGHEVVLTREPGGTPNAEAVRTLLVSGTRDWQPMAEALLHMTARIEHVADVIRPALLRGAIVISDRYVDSTRVYQGIGQGVGVETVDRLHELALDGPMPDLTLLLDLPIAVGMARAAARGDDEHRYERMGAAFHEKLREGFLRLAEREKERFVVIDATGEPERVAQAVRAAVRERCGV